MATYFSTSRTEKPLSRDGGLRKSLPSTLSMTFRSASRLETPIPFLLRLVAMRFFFRHSSHRRSSLPGAAER